MQIFFCFYVSIATGITQVRLFLTVDILPVQADSYIGYVKLHVLL